MYSFLLCLFVGSSLCLHLKMQNNNETFLAMYLDNQALDKFAVELFAAHPFNSRIGQCNQDNGIKYIHLGPNEPPMAIIMCNIHARQVITAEICVNWAKQHLESPTSNLSIHLFYSPNTARDKVIKESVCLRKGPNGIDLNRNFPTQFDFYKASKDKNSQIYPGTQPISEPFTIFLNEMIETHQPLLFLDIHSGENGGLFYQQGFNSEVDKNILQKVNENICNQKCRITTLAKDGQSINGHIFADLKVRRKVKYSLLIQSYGNNSTDCLRSFNPDNLNSKRQQINKWVQGISLIIEQVRQRQNL